MPFQLLETPTHVAVFILPARESELVITADVVGYEMHPEAIRLPRPFDRWRKVGERVAFGPNGNSAEITEEEPELGVYGVTQFHADDCTAERDHDRDTRPVPLHYVSDEMAPPAIVSEFEPLVSVITQDGTPTIAGLWDAAEHFATGVLYHGPLEQEEMYAVYLGIVRPDGVMELVNRRRADMPTADERAKADRPTRPALLGGRSTNTLTLDHPAGAILRSG